MSQTTQTKSGNLLDRIMLEAAFTQALYQFKTNKWSLNQSVEALFNATDEYTQTIKTKEQ